VARIFVTHTPAFREKFFPAKALGALQALGEVVMHSGSEPLSAEALVAAARNAEIVLVDRLTPVPEAVARGLPETIALVRSAMDIRNIDIDAASREGILVTRAGPGFVAAVVELVFGLMVSLARGIPEAVAAYRTGAQPEQRMGVQLAGRTVGVIGYGNLGQRLAELGGFLGMRVLVCDPHKRVNAPEVKQVELAQLLSESDFVLCVPIHGPQTEKMMDQAAFARMKRSAFFVNVSRGGVVDEAALEAALVEGRIAGAALDVGRHTADDLPNPRIAALPNVVATPHIGGTVPESTESQSMDTVRQIAEILQARAPAGSVNAEAATRLGRFADRG
jgi:D-3-phosphoglycerate dehydrogenase / 2-oxoglutarate reductase